MFSRASSCAVAMFLLALVAAGCGQHSPGSPLAPSPTTSPTTGTGATITGTVNGGGSLSARMASTTGAAGMTVTVAGTSISTTVDGLGHFVLTGVPSGTIRLEFAGPGTSASVTLEDVAPSEQISISVTVSGTTASVDMQQRTGSGKVEIEGRITAVTNGATRSLQVAAKTVTVPADATIRHGDTPVDFSALQVGDRVHVRGTPNGDIVVAELVIVQETVGTPPPPPPPAQPKIEMEGRIAAINPEGTSRTLVVDTTRVSVPTTAEIRHGDTAVDFAVLKVGDRVHVRGTMSGNVLVADLVLLQNDNPQVPVNVKGTVSSVLAGSACPAIRFLVAGWTVETDASTDFRKGSCASITAGTSVHVFGHTTDTGRVRAEWVQIDK